MMSEEQKQNGAEPRKESTNNGGSQGDKAHDAQRQYADKMGNYEVKLEGLSDGYRFTVKGDEEKIRKNRQAAAAFINFGKQADKAGWWLPWPLRFLLRFWSKYK